MFNKILIANRGEIACRVIKTAKRMGIRTVAVYSDVDRKALHVQLADEAIHVGGAASSESYLLGDRIIQAALTTRAQAIHPGYGFLSENAGFAQQCADNKLVFIGPPIAAIQAMGSKSAAKNIMQKAGVPLVPGYHGDDQDTSKLKSAADDMGYPVLLKAVAGGGGKGMRQVWNSDEFDSALTQAKSEAMASFGDDIMLVEKYLTQPRHVEVQVFCDAHDNGVYLFERDCSVQRRHQKIIEEAPAPNMPDGLREAMGEAAIKAAQAINYQGAGTVEFLLDTDASFYFMEMNTRLQVEHPVTEMITGQDLVEWQLRVANGEPLPRSQEQLKISGHAFEARIYAEDPNNDFLPTAGTLVHMHTPSESKHVRIDTGVVQGDQVSPFYDPMIAKLIVWDENRDSALTRLAQALTQYQISGVTTNIAFLHRLATSAPFVAADLDTGFIQKHQTALFGKSEDDLRHALPLIQLALILEQQLHNSGQSPWQSHHGWRLNQATKFSQDILLGDKTHTLSTTKLNDIYELEIDGQTFAASGTLTNNQLIAEIDGYQQRATLYKKGDNYTLFGNRGATEFTLIKPDLGSDEQSATGNDFSAPMNGTVVDVLVAPGVKVNQGDALIVMEAMKMQHTIHAPSAGQVTDVFCAKGDLVDGGTDLLSFEAVSSGSR